MTRDVRLPLHDVPIEGSENLEEHLNERFRTMLQAVLQLQQRTLIEPRAVPPLRAYDGQIEFADGVNWSPDGTGLPGLFYYWEGQWYAIADSNPAKGHMHWHGLWSVGYYRPGSVVYDDGWTMVCTNPAGCTERPAPQPTGVIEPDLPDTPAWTQQSFLGVAWTGHEYNFTKSGWIQSLSIWVTELTADTNYRILIINNTDPNFPNITTIEEPVLNLNAWSTIGLGAMPATAGDQWFVVVDALNSGGDTVINGGWTRSANSNAGEPPAQSWNMRTQDDTVRIDFTDLDSVDRQTELESVIAGSTIEIVSTTNALQSATFSVNTTTTGATSVIYNVTRTATGPAGDPPVGVDCQFTITVPIPLETEYVEILGHWPANNPSFADINGIKRLGGVDQPAADNAYGVRIHFQEAIVSSEWEMVAYTDQI